MDSLVTAAARALRAGDPLGALKRIALRDDAPALALRGIAMAQLGELAKARVLLRRAARAFGPRERVERARCATAEAEIALVSRDLRGPTHALDEARRTFGALGDRDNELHAALLQIRRLLLIGRVTEAGGALDKLDLRAAPAMLMARGELVAFEIALRRGHTAPARAALARARDAADRSGINPLRAEVERAELTLALPAARLIARGAERPLVLAEVETVLASQHLIVDACRRVAQAERREVRLGRRPVLFALLRSLAEAWPGEATREMPGAQAAEIVREYGPFPDATKVGGVTFDGTHVWFAAGDTLRAFDPSSGRAARVIDVAAHAGTAFDGRYFYQIAGDRIQKVDPATGTVITTIPAPGNGNDSGLTWAEGTLWVGQYRDRKIHQIDPQTGAILRTIESNRFVTGVTWVDGELWHGTWEDDESDIRRIDPKSGKVLARLTMPEGVFVSGLESDGAGLFYAGGGATGKVRAVRRPKRMR